MATNNAQLNNRTPYGLSSEGYYVLENKRGETVRSFLWEESKIVAIYRHDNRRVETVSSVKPLEDEGIGFEILGETTPAKLKKTPLEIGSAGRIRWVSQINAFSETEELAPEKTLETKKALVWSVGAQVGLALLITISGFIAGLGADEKEEVTVTLLDQKMVEKMLEEKKPEPPKPQPKVQKEEAPVPPPPKKQKEVVVAVSEKKIKKTDPVPTRSTSFKKTAKVAKKNAPRGGGYKGSGNRGYGTNEASMNSIGALGALTKGGNGGKGGLNLRAVGTDDGSGAGGQGRGGFGSNGGGGRGLGGIAAAGRGQGLANAMYGKGMVAAPFGEGTAAPGAGGYGTRGKAGGGARGAGYGSETIVGSWKGTGPKGIGAPGSGAGNGGEGSPWGLVDGDDDDALITGGLDRDQINEVIMRNLGQIRYCYEQGLQTKPSLSGRVAVRFNIGAAGRVTLANVKHSSVRSGQVEGCIVGKLKNWKFPKPHGGVTVAVTYPFVLSRGVSMR